MKFTENDDKLAGELEKLAIDDQKQSEQETQENENNNTNKEKEGESVHDRNKQPGKSILKNSNNNDDNNNNGKKTNNKQYKSQHLSVSFDENIIIKTYIKEPELDEMSHTLSFIDNFNNRNRNCCYRWRRISCA